MPSEDLRSRVEKWVNDQGYPLEMRVAEAFRNVGFNVTQSQYYVDKQSGLARETDVVASVQRSLKGGGVFRIEFIVECKMTVGTPWLLFCAFGPRAERHLHPSPWGVAQRYASRTGVELLSKIALDRQVQANHLFRLRPPLAYGMTRACWKKEDRSKDHAYEAMCSVSSAVRSTASFWNSHKHNSSIIEILLPVIVVSGNLFSAILAESGRIAVSEITEGTILWRNPSEHLANTIITILTESALPQRAREWSEGCNALFDRCTDKAQEITEPKEIKRV